MFWYFWLNLRWFQLSNKTCTSGWIFKISTKQKNFYKEAIFSDLFYILGSISLFPNAQFNSPTLNWLHVYWFHVSSRTDSKLSRAGSRFVLFPLDPEPWRGKSLPEVSEEQTLKDINLNKRSCEIYRYSRATQILDKDYITNQPKKIHIIVKK